MKQINSMYPGEPSGALENSRRAFIYKAATGLLLATGALTIPFQRKHAGGKIKAVAFDAFAIFNPLPVFALTEKIFPGKGKEIAESWRIKQFEYTWLRQSADQYRNFMDITIDALVFATRKALVTLSDTDKTMLVNAYLSLELWPDVLPTLEFLKKKSIRMGFLSNMTEKMLDSSIKYNRLSEYFEAVLSTDRVKSYKPSPGSYQMGPDAFHLEKSEILYIAFAGWDAAGAKWFGYPTYWVNRLDSSPEELQISADRTGKTLDGIRNLV